MSSNNNRPKAEEFSFFDIGETENQNYQSDLWLRLNTGERVYIGFPDMLCQQCYQDEGLKYVHIGECKFLLCDDCERRNFLLVTEVTLSVN